MHAALLSPEQIAQIAWWGLKAKPREACGVFVRGTLMELPNHATENDLSSIHKDDLEPIVSQYEDLRREELIFWHTHPGGFVGPSKMDMDNRTPGFSYLVVTLNADGSHTASAY